MERQVSEMVTMVALHPHYYRRDLKTGEQYDCDPDDAVLLERTGAAKPVAPKSKKEYKNRQMVSEK